MAEPLGSPTIPNVADWAKIVKRADGSQVIEFNQGFVRFLIGERGRISNVNSGVDDLAAAQIQAQANAATQVAAANAAAQAAIASSGSTATDYADFTEQAVLSGTFSTYATCDITTDGSGDYTVTASMVVSAMSDSPASGVSPVFSGGWQIIENPNGHVLASGTFTVTSTPFNEAGITFYSNELAFGTALPSSAVYPDSETGATTIELQLRRTSGTNNASLLSGSLLTTWA